MSKNKELKKPDLSVFTQANKLILSGYSMSAAAMRMKVLMLSKIHPGQANITKAIRITAEEYAELAGVTKSRAYKDIKKGGRELMHCTIKTEDKQRFIKEEWVVVNWMRYHKGEGWIELTFSPFIAQYIHHLTKNGYTTAEVKDMVGLSRFYSMRLYELLMQWKTTGTRFLTSEVLRKCLGIEDRKYNRFSDLKRHVIEPAVKEINEKTGWLVLFIPNTKNKKSTIEFIFNEKDKLIQINNPPMTIK